MWQMPFYDVMLLYKAYSDYVDKENKKSEESDKDADIFNKQQSQIPNYSNMPDIGKYQPTMPDANSITQGFLNNAQTNFNNMNFNF